MSDKHANHPHLPLLLLPILPLPSSSFTCSVYFSFWYTVSNPPPEKKRIANPPFPQFIKEVWVLNASPSASRAKTRRRHLFLSLLAKNGGGLKPPPSPLWPKGEENSKPPPPMFEAKAGAGCEGLLPSPSGQRGEGIQTTALPSIFTSSALSPFPHSLPGPWACPVPSLGHSDSCLSSSWDS